MKASQKSKPKDEQCGSLSQSSVHQRQILLRPVANYLQIITRILYQIQAQLLGQKSSNNLFLEKIRRLIKDDLFQIEKRLNLRLSTIEQKQDRILQLAQSQSNLISLHLAHMKEIEDLMFEAKRDYEKMKFELQKQGDEKRFKKINAVLSGSRDESPILSQMKEIVEITKTIKSAYDEPKPISQKALELVEAQVLKKFGGNGTHE